MDRLVSIPDRDSIKLRRESSKIRIKRMKFQSLQGISRLKNSALALRLEFYNNYYLVFLKLFIFDCIID